MAITRKYDNGPNGWNDYDDNGNTVASGTYNAPGTARNPFNADAKAQGKTNFYDMGMNNGDGSLYTNNAYGTAGTSGGGGSSSSYQPTAQQTSDAAAAKAQQDYQDKLTAYQTQVAQAAAASKQLALKQAWEGNTQALNSQNEVVGNNFTSAKNNLTALQASRSGEYQGQKDATSQEAAAQLRRTQALNAMTGNYNSGYNRSQMSDVGLARQASLGAIGGAENTFNDSVSNQISDADAQRVAALNDIAGKLSLGQQQFNDGTLNVSNQLTSDIATGSLKASLDAQAWSDQQAQLGAENSSRDAQLALSTKIADATAAYQQGQLTLDQKNSEIANAVAAAGVTRYAPKPITDMYPEWDKQNNPTYTSSGTGHTFGLAADVAENPGTQLYIPGVTKLGKGDIFLGGTGTGVSDAELNGASRVAGTTTNDTSSSYSNSGAKLPASVASQYPGATNVIKVGTGYKFTYNGVVQWYSPQ